MRCLQPLVLACALVVGCVSIRPDVVVSHYEPNDSEPVQADPGGIDLYVGVAERPVGDRFLNQGLWEFADEQTPFVHDLERKRPTEQNGFRVGLLGGTPSGPFQNLLGNNSCPDPRRLRVQPGHATTIDIGNVWSSCAYRIVHKDRDIPVELEQAQCQLQLLAHRDGDNKVRLIVTPQVRHGQSQLTPRPVLDPSGDRRWDLQMRNPEEVYNWLNWTAVLGVNDYLVIGGRMERTESLGRRMFLFTETSAPVQRVVVLRAVTTPNTTVARKPKDSVVPLAAQALGAVPVASRIRGVSADR